MSLVFKNIHNDIVQLQVLDQEAVVSEVRVNQMVLRIWNQAAHLFDLVCREE